MTGSYADDHEKHIEVVGHIGDVPVFRASCKCGWATNIRHELAAHNAWQRHYDTGNEAARLEQAGDPHYEHPAPHTKRWGSSPIEMMDPKVLEEWRNDSDDLPCTRERCGTYEPHEWDAKRADIAKNGMRDPIDVTYFPDEDYGIVEDGNHRLSWALELGHDSVPVRKWAPGEHPFDQADQKGRPASPPPKQAVWINQVSRPYQDDAIAEPKDDIEPVMPPLYEGNFGVWPDDMVEQNARTTHPVDVFANPKTGAEHLHDLFTEFEQRQAMPRDDDFINALTFDHRVIPGTDAFPYADHVLDAWYPGADHSFGQIRWTDETLDSPPTISSIEVNPHYQRHGLGTELLHRAKEIEPDLHHDSTLTDDGHELVVAVGDAPSKPVTPRKVANMDRVCVKCKNIFDTSEDGEATGFCGNCREKEGLVTHHTWSEDSQKGHYGHNEDDDDPFTPKTDKMYRFHAPGREEQVRQHGFKAENPNGLAAGTDREPFPGMPAGVYMYDHDPSGMHDKSAGDLYEIDVRGLDLLPDFNIDGSWYHPGDIPPERIRKRASSGCQNTCSCKDTGVPCACEDCVCHQKTGHNPDEAKWNDPDVWGPADDGPHDVMYHVSDKPNLHKTGFKPGGTHLFLDDSYAYDWGQESWLDGKPGHLYEVNTKGLNIRPDHDWADVEGEPNALAHLTLDAIPAERVKYVEPITSWKDDPKYSSKKNTKRAIVAIGIPGSGKSTVMKPYAAALGAAYISSDEARGEITGDPGDVSQDSVVWPRLYEKLHQALDMNDTVVFDSTASDPEKRRDLIRHLREKAGYVMGVHFDTPLDVALSRNDNRDRYVPPEVIRKMHDQLQEHPPGDEFDDVQKISDHGGEDDTPHTRTASNYMLRKRAIMKASARYEECRLCLGSGDNGHRRCGGCAGSGSQGTVTCVHCGRKLTAVEVFPQGDQASCLIHEAAPVDEKAVELLKLPPAGKGGFTMHDETGEELRGSGFIVSKKGHEEHIGYEDVSPERLEAYRGRHRDALDQGLWGGWNNVEIDGNAYLDAVEHHSSHADAKEAANRNYQRTFFRLPGTNGAHDEGGVEDALASASDGTPMVGLASKESERRPHLILLPDDPTEAAAALKTCMEKH